MDREIADLNRLIGTVEARRTRLAASDQRIDDADAVLRKLRVRLEEAVRYDLAARIGDAVPGFSTVRVPRYR